MTYALEDAMGKNQAGEDWSLVEQLDQDPGVLATLDREAYCRAVRRVAASTGGIVTAAQIRAELKRKVNPHRIGGIVNGFVTRGLFIDTGRTALSGDTKNRNRNRRLPVWQVPDWKKIK